MKLLVIQLVSDGAGIVLQDRVSPRSLLFPFLYHLLELGAGGRPEPFMEQRTRPHKGSFEVMLCSAEGRRKLELAP